MVVLLFRASILHHVVHALPALFLVSVEAITDSRPQRCEWLQITKQGHDIFSGLKRFWRNCSCGLRLEVPGADGLPVKECHFQFPRLTGDPLSIKIRAPEGAGTAEFTADEFSVSLEASLSWRRYSFAVMEGWNLTSGGVVLAFFQSSSRFSFPPSRFTATRRIA